MDIMIPYLGTITRLVPDSKRAFYIAGVQRSAQAKKIELEEHKKREIEEKLNISQRDENITNNNDDDESPHVDTWA